jgi:2-oxoglutaroyl-CoA hydrolase
MRRPNMRRRHEWRIMAALECHCYSRLRASDDFHEGVEALHRKRRPTFIGS